jgi:hypothetical protein
LDWQAGKHEQPYLHVLVGVVPCEVQRPYLNQAAVLRHEKGIEQALAMHTNHHICLAAVHQVSFQVPATAAQSTRKPMA